MHNFSTRVLTWFNHHGRQHLPWQQKINLYRIWVSEIMLQQTQVATVIPYFNRFMDSFPTLSALENANIDQVLSHWAGLGYYSRARNLHKAAQIIRERHKGIFPEKIDDVIALPGIGKSTAGAILSLACRQRHSILDGNVKRVLSRHQLINGIPNQPATLKKQWAIAEKLTPEKNCHHYTQAMMDLGSMICTRTKPDCQNCPIHADCGAYLNRRINDYPNKKPKKTLPEKSTIMLILLDQEEVYLEKRPSKGIWGGLWSLPEVTESTIDTFLTQQHLSKIKQRQLDIYTHTFTHYRLHITPVLIEVTALNNGYSKAQLDNMGLPTPIQRILSNIL
ncbi:MAG: A/G-specific adenine glycosylase [Ostreibacterium sp.]